MESNIPCFPLSSFSWKLGHNLAHGLEVHVLTPEQPVEPFYKMLTF